jgi:hypothetical protein
MRVTTKVGHVSFLHDDLFRGEVEIVRGEQRISVPMEALKKLVAEAVRADLLDHVVRMKPEALLRRIA